MKKRRSSLCFFLLACFPWASFGQTMITIGGVTTAPKNSSRPYSAVGVPSYYSHWEWNVSGSNYITSETYKTCQVQWVEAGSHVVDYDLVTFDNYYYGSRNVTVSSDFNAGSIGGTQTVCNNVSTLSLQTLLGPTRTVSGGLGAGVNVTAGYADWSAPIYEPAIIGVSAGVGITLGGSYAVGETRAGWWPFSPRTSK